MDPCTHQTAIMWAVYSNDFSGSKAPRVLSDQKIMRTNQKSNKPIDVQSENSMFWGWIKFGLACASIFAVMRFFRKLDR